MTRAGGLALVVRLARKELREILRDRRTIVTLVLMPILLYPLLSIAFRQYFLSTVAPTTTKEYRVAIADAEALVLEQMLQLTKDDPTLTQLDSPDVAGSVRAGDVDVGVRLTRVPGQRSYDCEILFREDSAVGIAAADFLKDRLTQANIRMLLRDLEARGVRRPVVPISVTTDAVPVVAGQKSSLLASLIPLVLVLMTITGAVYPAIDLTAGERERGTLEILMAAPIPRLGLLLAKYVAVLTVAMLTGLVNLGMMTVTLLASGLSKTIFGEAGLHLGTMLAVLALLLLFAMFFSAVLLAVTSFARSFKEAQAYLIPLMLASITPGMLALMPGLQLSGLITITPLLNIVLLAREILQGGAPATETAIVVVSTLLYALVAIGLAARLFGAEAVLYSDRSHWSDLLRRPAQARETPTLTAGLACAAFAFPLSLLVGGGLSRMEFGQDVRLLLSILASVVLFAGLPLVSAWLSHVRPTIGFQLRSASFLALAGAVVLGLSLWPVVGELIAAQRWMGISTMPQALKDRLGELAEQRRQTSPVLVLLALAVVPAVVEELFFRGYLFNAIRSVRGGRQAILLTALIFGVFHVFTGGILLIERLLPTFVMGLCLGWVRWRAGSVWPGILLHVLHNGLLVSASLFPESFRAVTSAIDGAEHIPPLWLLASAGAIAVGSMLVWFAKKPVTTDSAQPETT